MHDSMRSLMSTYDLTVRKLLEGRQYFFSSKMERPFPMSWLRRSFRMCWLKYNQMPQGVKGLSCSMLRSDYVLRNVNAWIGTAGEDNMVRLLALSRSLGHSSLKTTMRYFALSRGMSGIMDKLVVDGYNEVIPVMKEKNNEKVKANGKER